MENELFNDDCMDCIEEMSTGRRVDTEMIPVNAKELKSLDRRSGWEFKWHFHNLVNREETVFKLIVKNDPKREIQGLISFRPSTGFIWVGLVENAPHNRGFDRRYKEVFKNMYAFVGMRSFVAGFDGYIAFKSKTLLMDHYQREVGAKLVNFRDKIMEIDTEKSKNLVNLYYKKFFHGR
jgi:hypothetical protein